jgi:hypothetical protein
MSSTLDGVVYKIDNSNSTMNLYTNFSQNDRITLNSTPCDRNSTDSCRGLVSNFTPTQFQAFDVGRVTTQTEAQLEDSTIRCMLNCTGVQTSDELENLANTVSFRQCENICYVKIARNTRKDFI